MKLKDVLKVVEDFSLRIVSNNNLLYDEDYEDYNMSFEEQPRWFRLADYLKCEVLTLAYAGIGFDEKTPVLYIEIAEK